MKRIFLILFAIIIFGGLPRVVYAQQSVIKQEAITRTDLRINDLQQLLDSIGSDTNLSNTVKNDLDAQVRSVVSQLNSLKAKINQDQGDTAVQQDFAGVLSQKVYACFLPKILLLKTDERFIFLADRLETLLQKINKLNAQNNSTADLQNQLQVLKTNLNAIKSQIQTIDRSANCSQSVQSLKQQLVKSGQDFNQLKALLEQLKNQFGGGSISGVPGLGGHVPPGCYYKPIACPMIACRVGGPCPTCTPQLICPSGVPTITPVPPPGCYYAPGKPCPCTGAVCPMCFIGPRLVCPSGVPQPSKPVVSCVPYPPQCGQGKMCPYAIPVGGWCPVSGSPVSSGGVTAIPITASPCGNIPPCPPGKMCPRVVQPC